MSRSRKRIAIFKQPNDQDFKRYSNKMIRHRDLPSGGAFRKVMNSWSICDYKHVLYRINPQYADLYDEKTMRKAVMK